MKSIAMALLAASLLAGQTLKKTEFGKLPGGTAVELFSLTNKAGGVVSITPYGATIVSIRVPDKQGKLGDVVHGFDTLDGYLKVHPYFGAVVGRYGNRIAKGRFKLHGVEYKLAVNNGENHLHGGLKGFDKVLWKVTAADSRKVSLQYISPDGEEGYPGTLTVNVTYSWRDDHSLTLDYSFMSEKDTVANITNHTYFNLAGSGDILKHVLKLEAARFTPVDAGLIPIGEIRPVKGTPFDFATATAIGARIDATDQQIQFGKGYDHNFVLNSQNGKLAKAAEVWDPASGRVLEVMTTEPGVQFYTGNFLDGTVTGKAGTSYALRSAFCLETQRYPDSPNQLKFPSVVRKAGHPYRSTTVFRFKTR